MAIEIGELVTDVQVEATATPSAAAGTPRLEPPPESQQSWEAIARRQSALALRVSAWDFED